jgi:hypothetical protein
MKRPPVSRLLAKWTWFNTYAVITIAAALTISPASLAGVKISSDAGTVVVDAQNASIEEIFEALSRQYDLRYRSSANLQTKITGTYEGPLRRVVKRILGTRDFIIKVGASLVDVTVLGEAGTIPTIAQAPASTQIDANQVNPANSTTTPPINQ